MNSEYIKCTPYECREDNRLEEEECYNPRNLVSKQNKTINCHVEPVNSLNFK